MIKTTTKMKVEMKKSEEKIASDIDANKPANEHANELNIVQFLIANSSFFERHVNLLDKIKLHNPYGKRTLSLIEKQNQLLREKNKLIEQNFTQLICQAKKNDEIVEKITHWAASLLNEKSNSFSPEKFCTHLRDVFDLSQVKLFVNHFNLPLELSPYIELMSEQGSLSIQTLKKPYCVSQAEFVADNIFSRLNIHIDICQSLAILPLFPIDVSALSNPLLSLNQLSQPAFGLLILGDENPKRFLKNQDVHFLEKISVLASASLSRFV